LSNSKLLTDPSAEDLSGQEDKNDLAISIERGPKTKKTCKSV
jgi:hypothetical protein